MGSALALVFVWLVGQAATGFPGVAGRLLEMAPLVYLGKISYGVYVYHLFVRDGLAAQGIGNDWSGPGSTTAHFLLLTACTVALASVSWFCFEKPINNLKRYFPYGT